MSVLDDITVTDGRYTTLTRIVDVFGKANVEKWAVMDSADDAATQARIERAIEDAEDYMDDFLRGGPYPVPFVTTIPKSIQIIASNLAGVLLYEARGTLDVNPDFGTPQHRLQYQKRQAHKKLSMIKSGRTILSIADNSTRASFTPKVGTDFSGSDNCEC